MESHFKVIIIGAGTAGMTARREIAKSTDNYILIHDGPLGTTCARVGCMPSKALIQVANDLHHSKILNDKGFIELKSSPDQKKILNHVRSLRDHFVGGIVTGIKQWENHIIKGRARFTGENSVEVNGKKFTADSFVIATGSRPVIPKDWLPYKKFILTSDEIFELEDLPKRLLVVGLGVIGLELGQALSRLGVHVTAVTLPGKVAGISDPAILEYVLKGMREEVSVLTCEAKPLSQDGNVITVDLGGVKTEFDKVFMAVGRTPNLDTLGLNEIGIKFNEKGVPTYDENNLFLTEHPHIFLAGDVNAHRPILHEAADDGRIAGYNAVNEVQNFKRRIFLGITFCDPQVALVGESFRSLNEKQTDFVIGTVNFEEQGRALTKFKNRGLLNVYVKRDTGHLLGAEFQCPDGEHIAHLLAWAISMKMTVSEALSMPFYHPVIEEGLRTALRMAAGQVSHVHKELYNCEDPPIR